MQKFTEHRINNCVKELKTESKLALYLAAWMLMQLEVNNNDINLCEQCLTQQFKSFYISDIENK